MKKKLTYPNLRQRIMPYICELADLQYQKENWLSPKAFHLSFDWFVDVFFNDLNLDSEVYHLINDALYDEQEAEKLKVTAALLSNILDDLDYSTVDTEFINYLNHPKWSEVVAKAQELYNLMKTNDVKYGFEEQLKSFYGANGVKGFSGKE